MEDNVSKIKDRLDVVDVLSSYMKLQKAGINYKGRCPFHNEKTPSFFVSPERQIWHCFGCAKGGDMFEFVKEIESVDFPEALKILANRAGIELEQYKPRPGESVDTKQRLMAVVELACKFFEKQFQSTLGKEALAYLHDRGLTDETIKEFRLGFAPDDWESLSQFLLSRGYTEKEIVDAGMAIFRRSRSFGEAGVSSESASVANEVGRVASDSEGPSKNGIYDRFRSRIMFPIFEVNGEVVGFTGRTFESPKVNSGEVQLDREAGSMAKYVNTPQTLIYDKSRVLYGLSKAKLEIKKADRCILVEGNMDALMSFQAGVRNVVASSGTALTPTHLRLLQRYTKNLGFCFDTDQAGAMATRRGIGLALAQQFNIQVLEINDSECKDPADYVKKYASLPAGRDHHPWVDVAASAKPVIDYYFDRARSSYNPTSAQSKSEIIAAVAPFVKRLSAHVERAHWIAQLAALLRVPEPAIAADIASFKDDLDAYINRAGEETGEPAAKPKVAVAQQPLDAIHEMLLSVVLKNPSAIREQVLTLPEHVLDERVLGMMRAIVQEDPFEFSTFVARYSGEDAMQLEFAHLRSQELWSDFTDENLPVEFHNLVTLLRRRAIQARLAALQFDVKEAEAAKDASRLAQLAGEFNELARQLITTHHPYGPEEKQKQEKPETKAESKTNLEQKTQGQSQTETVEEELRESEDLSFERSGYGEE